MPGPVSRTDTWNEPLLASALMATSPASVNLMALPTRLIRTCVNRRPSPRPGGSWGAISTLNPSFLSAANAGTGGPAPSPGLSRELQTFPFLAACDAGDVFGPHCQCGLHFRLV